MKIQVVVNDDILNDVKEYSKSIGVPLKAIINTALAQWLIDPQIKFSRKVVQKESSSIDDGWACDEMN